MAEQQGVDVAAIVGRFRAKQPDFAERYAAFEEKRGQFTAKFSPQFLREMELDDYVTGKTSIGLTDTFCYQLEHPLSEFGKMRVPGSYSYGVWYSANEGRYRFDEQRLGKKLEKQLGREPDLDDAFTFTKESIAGLVESAGSGDYEAVKSSWLYWLFRGKIVSTYFPDEFVPIFSKEMLERFCHKLGVAVSGGDHQLDLQRKLAEWKHAQPELEGAGLVEFAEMLGEYYGWKEPGPGEGPGGEEGDGGAGAPGSQGHPLNQILYGPPGTGKTYSTMRIAVEIIDGEVAPGVDVKRRYKQLEEEGRIGFVTFHQSFSYEDFIEGIRPDVSGESGELSYEVRDGVFKAFCDRASTSRAGLRQLQLPETAGSATGEGQEGIVESVEEVPYVFVIDEVNRGNVSAIFGELITCLEEGKRLGGEEPKEPVLPYSGARWGIPSNVYVVATMNTADRSLTQLDSALRRRFTFKEVMPDSKVVVEEGAAHGVVDGVRLDALLDSINERVEALYDREHTIGHSYLLDVVDIDGLNRAFAGRIIPLLQEYFFDDYEKIRIILNDADGAFVRRKDNSATRSLVDARFPGYVGEVLDGYDIAKPGGWTAAHFANVYSGGLELGGMEPVAGE